MFNRTSGWRHLCFLVAVSVALMQVAAAKERGVIAGAAGSGELRAEKSATAEVVGTVKPGEPLSFEQDKRNEWGKVTLGSGKSGWLPLSQIRLFYDQSDLPKKDPSGLSEITRPARARGLDYVKVTRLVAKGDAKALKQFFALAREADGAAAESITTIPTAVYDVSVWKVTRAELIERKTGKVLVDMTADDIGTGAEREGKIVWSPDSKRFASLSTKMNAEQGNLFSEPRQVPHRKQTAVYQVTGDSWSRVEMPLDKVPGRERDTELERAMLGHDYIEPVRWQKKNVLLVERHEYYEKKKPIENSTIEQIVGLSRRYSITATISPEGKATVVWKIKKDR